ncbi:hypothetical protein H4683_001788 [Filibacter limicola]|uniref:DUF1259 domain-containing protein n=1 Tax=Sporosarcina limicola TaxID=34101 RepID=A0A927MHV8_9BACL|nr:hypothetical protein [Sporosarcina limicola]
MQSVTQQGLIVGALHNHWLYMNPALFYISIQFVESPMDFAKKLAYSFSLLSCSTVAE